MCGAAMYVLPSSLFVTQSFSEYSKALLPNITSKEIYGAEFSTYDYGQKTLLPAINDRHGQVAGWNFEYLDFTDDGYEKGFEGKATFDDLALVRARCFSNNKVVEAAGAFTHGCGGSDYLGFSHNQKVPITSGRLLTQEICSESSAFSRLVYPFIPLAFRSIVSCLLPRV